MNHKSITPNPQQPVDRVPAGQLPSALAQLSEEVLGGSAVAPSSFSSFTLGGFGGLGGPCILCSYDGDDA